MRLRIVIAFVLVLGLTGCATAAPAATAPPTPAAAETATTAGLETAEPTVTVMVANPTIIAEVTSGDAETATTAPEVTAEPPTAVAATVEVTEAAAATATLIAAGEPSVTVDNQPIVGGIIQVARVVSQGPGWMVIHADQDGAPGPVIGRAPLFDGVNEDVAVQIDASKATATLYAMLHTDAGTVATYEFPGADIPVQVNGAMVSPPFEITGGLPSAPEATATVAPTAAPTPAATAAATTAAEPSPTAAATTVAVAGDAAVGQSLAGEFGCVNCHSADGMAGIGPTWMGLYGSTVELHQGITVTADEAYLRQSIVEPSAQIVDGYPEEGRMPSYAGRLSDQQISDLIAYIMSLR